MRYKNLANRILAAVCALFVLAVILKIYHRESLAVDLLYTMVVAALVGGVADWFAVTALFKKPLGFPWHTAIIPRHRDKVIRQVADVVETQLLSVDYIKQRLDSVSFVRLLISWADSHGGKLFLRLLYARHMEAMIASVDSHLLARNAEQVIKSLGARISLETYLAEFGRWAISGGRDQTVADWVAGWLVNLFEKPDARDTIYRYLEDLKQDKARSLIEKFVFWMGEQTDSVNLDDAADALHVKLLELARQLQQPEHPVRSWMHSKLGELVGKLETRPDWHSEIEEWKQGILRQMELEDLLIRIFKHSAQLTPAELPLVVWLREYLVWCWQKFKEDTEMQDWLEVRIRQGAYRLIDNEHYLIGVVVEKVMMSFTDDDLSRFIEEKAGDDLQWIRVNGSVVGALVGLAAFLLLRFVYDPIVPFLIKWINI